MNHAAANRAYVAQHADAIEREMQMPWPADAEFKPFYRVEAPVPDNPPFDPLAANAQAQMAFAAGLRAPDVPAPHVQHLPSAGGTRIVRDDRSGMTAPSASAPVTIDGHAGGTTVVEDSRADRSLDHVQQRPSLIVQGGGA